MRQTVVAMTVFGAALGLSAGTASGQAGCPAGYVVQEVNFATKTVLCTSLSTKQITSLEAKVAALQAKVTALQAQLASLLTSPNGHYSISVGNTGIELASARAEHPSLMKHPQTRGKTDQASLHDLRNFRQTSCGRR